METIEDTYSILLARLQKTGTNTSETSSLAGKSLSNKGMARNSTGMKTPSRNIKGIIVEEVNATSATVLYIINT
jgi:hypothetical protein